MTRTLRIAVPTLAALALASAAAAVPARRMVTTQTPAEVQGASFSDRVAVAHAADAWNAHQAVQARIKVEWGGQEILSAFMTTSPDASMSRLRVSDGSVVVNDGENTWVAPATSLFRRAKWHATAWPYYLAAPYKLGEKGGRLRFLGRQTWLGSELAAARLTFLPEAGGAPSDWYVAYREEGSDMLAGLAYEVPVGGTSADMVDEPHAVVYSDWQDVDGVPVPMSWTFYQWNMDDGPHGEPIGHVTLSDVHFVTTDVTTFQRPGNARAEAMARRHDQQ